MKGRIEKIPSVTNPRVANVQKKSFERKASKKAISEGSLRAASTVAMLLAMNTATTGQTIAPSGARRIANRAMSATTNAAAQRMAVRGTIRSPLVGEGGGGGLLCGSFTAMTVMSSVTAMMTATIP